MNQEEYNRLTERTASLGMITYERQAKLIEWLLSFFEAYREQETFLLESIIENRVDILGETKKTPWKRLNDMEEEFKNFLTYYNTTPHIPTLKEIKSKSKRKPKYKEYV